METKTRVQFDALSVVERQKFVAQGGSVIEGPMLNKISREEFARLDPGKRMLFIRRGGTIESPSAPTPKGPRISDASLITRAEFEAMSPAQRAAAMQEGRKVVDGHRVSSAG